MKYRELYENPFVVGDIVQHFKRETISDERKASNEYLYQIKAFATHTETYGTMVVYQALYEPFSMWVRPLCDFCDKVDKEKYPDIKQFYRFEKYEVKSK